MDSFVKMLSQKSFDKITIKDIIEDCGLNRSTFYYYYEDIYALLEDVLQTELERITGKQVAYSSWQAGFLESAKFVLENKRAVYHIYNSIGREPLEKYLYQMTWDLMVGFGPTRGKGFRGFRRGYQLHRGLLPICVIGIYFSMAPGWHEGGSQSSDSKAWRYF